MANQSIQRDRTLDSSCSSPYFLHMWNADPHHKLWKDHKEDGVIEKVNTKYIFARDEAECSQFIHKCYRERTGPLKAS